MGLAQRVCESVVGTALAFGFCASASANFTPMVSVNAGYGNPDAECTQPPAGLAIDALGTRSDRRSLHASSNIIPRGTRYVSLSEIHLFDPTSRGLVELGKAALSVEILEHEEGEGCMSIAANVYESTNFHGEWETKGIPMSGEGRYSSTGNLRGFSMISAGRGSYDLLNAELVEEMLSSLIPHVPREAVGIGAQWTVTMRMPSMKELGRVPIRYSVEAFRGIETVVSYSFEGTASNVSCTVVDDEKCDRIVGCSGYSIISPRTPIPDSVGICAFEDTYRNPSRPIPTQVVSIESFSRRETIQSLRPQREELLRRARASLSGTRP